jgi:hypothetical protein
MGLASIASRSWLAAFCSLLVLVDIGRRSRQ